MPFTKSEQRTAPSGPNDLSMTFYVADAASGPNANEVVCQVNLGGTSQTLIVRDVAGLTGPQKTALRNALTVLRDAALLAAGFVDTP